ncbi:MAG: Dabb family protein [Hyphomicrobiales bacterium]|nr:MAG: Dabb family protein [Hyphomicrobiales bacterium]
MFVHVSIFRFLDSVSSEEADLLLEGIREIADNVTGIIDIACGASTSPYSRGLTHAILVRGTSPEILDIYREHPKHIAAAEMMDRSQLADATHQPGLVVDFID